MAAAGVAEGTEIDAIVPNGTGPGGIEWATLAAKIQSDLAQVGLQMNIQQLQSSELLNIYRAQDGKMVFMNWSPTSRTRTATLRPSPPTKRARLLGAMTGTIPRPSS